MGIMLKSYCNIWNKLIATTLDSVLWISMGLKHDYSTFFPLGPHWLALFSFLKRMLIIQPSDIFQAVL